MTTTTPNLGLTLWNDTTDITALFKDFRLGLTGPTSSNMTIIDTYFGNLSTLVNNTKGSFYLAGTGTNSYTATNTYITAYFSGLSIILYVNNSNTGASDLTINALGSKNLMKINSSGSVVALSAGDLILNTKYLFVYDGTQFILVGGVSADQIASLIHSATAKASPVDNDEVGLSDSEASYGLKKVLWSTVKAVWQTITHAATSKVTPVDNDELSIVDSEASNVIKKLLWSNVKATLKTYFDTLYAVAAKGVTNGDSHDHIGGDGSAITESAITLADNTTNDLSTSKHGFTPKAPADSQKVLGGLAGLWVTNDGWIAADETWTYASTTTHTNTNTTYSGTLTISGDKTGKYQAGHLVKFTQTTVKYGVITKVEYSAPNTIVTIFFGTDYSIANATITSPYFSMTRNPYGFPRSKSKWSVRFVQSSDFSQASPTQNQWYQAYTMGIPLGEWDINLSGIIAVISTASQTAVRVSGTLATTTAAETSTEYSFYQGISGASGSLVCIATYSKRIPSWTQSANGTIYFNMRTVSASAAVSSITTAYANQPGIIDAVCGYI